jgi:DeoR family deoxyribose operon repressor
MQTKMERISRVVNILRERNGAAIKELAGELGVSEMTIRRDLERLRLDNIISLVHGAAIYKSGSLPNSLDTDYHVALEEAVRSPEKERIGKAAARMVCPGDTIIIDIGTTTEMLAKHLSQNCPITVLCFTMNVLADVHKKNVENLIMGGGYYHANTQLFESAESVALIRRIRAAKLFLSAAGVSREMGLTTVHQYEVQVKQACIASSLQKILLVDSKKFDQIRPAYVAPLDTVNTVITDEGISPEWIRILKDMDIDVRVV